MKGDRQGPRPAPAAAVPWIMQGGAGSAGNACVVNAGAQPGAPLWPAAAAADTDSTATGGNPCNWSTAGRMARLAFLGPIKKGTEAMTTVLQVEANQRNALASTGPKTAAGKARVSQNALRHGAFS